MTNKLVSGGQNTVRISGDRVTRTHHPWSLATRKLLAVCAEKQLDFVPKWLGQDKDGNEVFEYMDGQVGHDPLPLFLTSDVTVCSAGKTFRQFHDAARDLVDDETLTWQFAAKRPAEVICHGDFASYNCTFKDANVVGVFDFDCAFPAPRLWDISYAIYRFSPFLNFGEFDDDFGDVKNRLRRMYLFVEAYGETSQTARNAFGLIPERLESMVNWMYQEAAQGNEHCQRSLDQGHHALYLRDHDAIKAFYQAKLH